MRQMSASVDNTFVKGVITEATGLNFPDHACIDADNCIFSLTGAITRRPGLDLEENFIDITIPNSGIAHSTYKWNNAGGDGTSQVLVLQVGSILYFYLSSVATTVLPLSSRRLISVIDIDSYKTGSTSTELIECDYTDGNGYLFVFNPHINPFYCTFASNTVTSNPIVIQIRDFGGVTDNVAVNQRPGTLSAQHQYNLSNQGWTKGSAWTATDSTTMLSSITVGSHSFTISAGLPITNGDNILVFADVQTYGFGQNSSVPIMTGSVTSYSGTTLVLNVYTILSGVVGGNLSPFTFTPTNTGYINTWFTGIGNYPSNADVWWLFKNTSNVFDPAVTNVSVTLNTGPAPKGHYILLAFDQQRDLISGISGLTDITTLIRPKTGTWFQGRVWYVGPDDSQAASGDQPHYSWSENIYFSQIVENISQLGYCYSNNDPTSQNFSDLLPSDGGVIRIQGCGSIKKLFPIQNGLLVFASNGIWFITGSQGIGFTANDYTITKISSVRALSNSSFVNILGYPMFWNEEGIYSVSPSQQGSLSVDNICLGTILSAYDDIPQTSKVYARGDYDPVSYIVTWLFKDTHEISIGDRYGFSRALNFNISTKAFSFDTFGTNGVVRDVKYIIGLGGDGLPSSMFKFLASHGTSYTFAELRDTTNWVDFKSADGIGFNYESFFITGYKLKGGALRRWQPLYTYVFTDNVTAYTLQGIWDYATSGSAGRYSSIETVYNIDANSSVVFKRHKIRGHGLSLQYKYSSIPNEPFTILGWSILESSNATI